MTDTTRPRRKQSARLIDIAEQAGVGIATVNRVLNEREGVSPELRAKVIAAAKSLGSKRLLPELHRGIIRFDVLLTPSDTPFFARLERALLRHAQALGSRFVIHRHRVSPAQAPRLIAALARSPQQCHGLIVALPESAAIKTALQAHINLGRPVVTLMSGINDLPGCRHAGIDNVSAGRTAAHFIQRQCQQPGYALIIANHPDYRVHMERVRGFTEKLGEGPQHGLIVLPAEFCEDDPDRAQMALRRAPAPLKALYTTGAGTRGLHAWLSRLPASERPIWVGHKASDEHRESMRAGLLDWVIDQDPDGQVACAMHHLLHATGHIDQPPTAGPHPFQLFCVDNMPTAAYLPAT